LAGWLPKHGHRAEISAHAEGNWTFRMAAKPKIFRALEPATEVLRSRRMEQEMRNETAEYFRNAVGDLYWLAFLLTGQQDISIEIASDTVSGDDASPFFADWMRGWQRRLVIGRALTAIHTELADSADRTQAVRVNGSATPPRNWSLSPDTTKADLEHALLAIDVFPRDALLLLVFEGIRMADAATLLGADPALIRKAQAIGLRQLIANLAGPSELGARSGDANPELLHTRLKG
jgi:hypothetical protein